MAADTQRELPYREPIPRAPQSETSRAAADALDAETVSAMERRIVVLLRERGADGATDQEMQEALGMPVSTQVPRRNALMGRGWVGDGGERRPTRSGRPATVWVLTRGYTA